MSNGIKARQNENKSIAMLAAQRQLYNEVEIFDILYFFLLVVLPVVFAIIQEMVASWDVVRFLSYGLSIMMIFVSFFIENICKQKKTLAASIQLEFDLYVYTMPWDNKLFGKKKKLSEVIAEKSKMILEDEKQNKSLFDWYTSVVDQMPIEEGIFMCQRENYHWDAGLRRRFRYTAICGIAALIIVIFLIGIIKNEPVQDLISRIIFVLPMVRWLVKISHGLKDDLERLNELEHIFSDPHEKTMEDLLYIQKYITEHRKNAIKIPNFFYGFFKDNDEDQAHRLASLDLKE